MRTQFIGFCLLFVSVATPSVVAQQDGVTAQGFSYEGIESCAGCHEKPLAIYRTDFVRLTEFAHWITRDKHSRSYLRIVPDQGLYDGVRQQFMDLQQRVSGEPIEERWSDSNELSARMCQKLGIDPATFKDARQCLSCHANWRKQDDKPDPAVFKWGVGVGCESCHGAASEWVKKENHQEPTWRQRDPREKHSKFGMVHVRDPVARARQCYSCHIGNFEEGKVITHAMYAAGHPPLPGIEVETFAIQMPHHWTSLDEKPDNFLHRADFEKFYSQEAKTGKNIAWQPGELPRTKAVVLGGVLAMRESIQLTVSLAQPQQPNQWPEFAAFDCAACHHELRTGSSRQQRRIARVPGRPSMHHWSSQLVRLGVERAAKANIALPSWRTQRDSWQRQFDGRPFGDPTRLADSDPKSAAQQTIALLDNLLTELQALPFRRDDARTALESLCDAGTEDDIRTGDGIIDYHGARQVAWAIRVLHSDLQSGVDSESDVQSPFKNLLVELSDGLRLELPAGAGGEITSQLPESLSAIANFDPIEFREKLAELGSALPEELSRLNPPSGR